MAKKNLKEVKSYWLKKFENAETISKEEILSYLNEMGLPIDFSKTEKIFNELKEKNEIFKTFKSSAEAAEFLYLMIVEFIEDGLTYPEAVAIVAANYKITKEKLRSFIFEYENIIALCEGYNYGLSNIPVIKFKDKIIKRVSALNDFKKILNKIKNKVEIEGIEDIALTIEYLKEMINRKNEQNARA